MITKKLQNIVNSLNEDEVKQEPKPVSYEELNPYSVYSSPPSNQLTDLKFLLKYYGFKSDDNKSFVKIYPDKTQAISMKFINEKSVSYAFVNKVKNITQVKEYSIDDIFMHMLYKG